MVRVESEREDLRQENSRLQAELRKLQRDRSPRAAQHDEKLQEHVQQAQRSSPPGDTPFQSKKDAADQGYTHTWRLVDQLRNQNRWEWLSTGCIALWRDKF